MLWSYKFRAEYPMNRINWTENLDQGYSPDSDLKKNQSYMYTNILSLINSQEPEITDILKSHLRLDYEVNNKVPNLNEFVYDYTINIKLWIE